MDDVCDFSVLMTAYNHENFVEQAVRSVLQQKFEGTIQIVIGVDKSADDTLAVCRQLQASNPEAIELIVHESNVGMFGNYRSVLHRCKGKYIALLEGDDYWTDKHKLQIQYDYFEAHPKCVLSSGKIHAISESGDSLPVAWFSQFSPKKILTKDDLVITNKVNTLTTAFRRSAVNVDEFEKLRLAPHLDWGLYLSLNFGEMGYVYRFNRVFGAYRSHAGGIYSQVKAEKRNENIFKTIYTIAQLDLKKHQRDYLQALFANFSRKLSSETVFAQPPYQCFYRPELLIYDQNGGLKKSYVSGLYKAVWLFFTGSSKDRSAFKFKWALLRQSKLSRRIYMKPVLLPFYLFMPIHNLYDQMQKRRYVRQTS